VGADSAAQVLELAGVLERRLAPDELRQLDALADQARPPS
jgi:aryl-alcohol dehydrogenase-like predicted oxidoreductase